MTKEETYTSTGIKLIYHPEVVLWIKRKRARPISLQVSPTSQCNLNCVFCSNVNRNRNEELDVNDLKELLTKLKMIGLKTIEWTGGGDPTMYPHINEMVRYAEMCKLEQGLITNGVLLTKNISKYSLSLFRWVRISMNCIDYIPEIDIPEIPGALGFSYVMNELTTDLTLNWLDRYVRRYNPEYVRIVPNCQSSDEEQRKNNLRLSQLVSTWGPPYFYQEKVFDKPEHCWWCYFKPFLNHDGYVYPCSSVILNSDADSQFHEKYRWCKMGDLVEMYQHEMLPFNSNKCNHCVFKSQNDIIDNLLKPNGMENFV